jgi:hypothetical protein
MCEINSTETSFDPEDGMTEDMVSKLTDGNVGVDEWTWEGIWRLVFPGDGEIAKSGEQYQVSQTVLSTHSALLTP